MKVTRVGFEVGTPWKRSLTDLQNRKLSFRDQNCRDEGGDELSLKLQITQQSSKYLEHEAQTSRLVLVRRIQKTFRHRHAIARATTWNSRWLLVCMLKRTSQISSTQHHKIQRSNTFSKRTVLSNVNGRRYLASGNRLSAKDLTEIWMISRMHRTYTVLLR